MQLATILAALIYPWPGQYTMPDKTMYVIEAGINSAPPYAIRILH